MPQMRPLLFMSPKNGTLWNGMCEYVDGWPSRSAARRDVGTAAKVQAMVASLTAWEALASRFKVETWDGLGFCPLPATRAPLPSLSLPPTPRPAAEHKHPRPGWLRRVYTTPAQG